MGRKSERGGGARARGGDSLNASRLVSSSSQSLLNSLLRRVVTCDHFPTCFDPLQTDIHSRDSLDSAFCVPILEVDPFDLQ